MVRWVGVTPVRVAYAVGVICLAIAGFFSPWWWLGFVPLGVGLIWASYDVIDVEVDDGNSPRTPRS